MPLFKKEDYMVLLVGIFSINSMSPISESVLSKFKSLLKMIKQVFHLMLSTILLVNVTTVVELPKVMTEDSWRRFSRYSTVRLFTLMMITNSHHLVNTMLQSIPIMTVTLNTSIVFHCSKTQKSMDSTRTQLSLRIRMKLISH